MIETCVALACAAAGGAIAKATTAAATRRLRGIGPTVARPRSGGSVRSVLTRQSQLLLPTEKRPPSDAEALSHKLMVRAGLVRQVGSGLWTWLPAGWRVHQKVVQIVREEMDAIGCQEMLMPVITPAELWKRSGRYAIDEVFKLRDRRDAELVLAMTHEET